MKRFIPAAAIAAALVTAAPAAAITNGVPDGNGHPSAGGLVADHAYSDGTWIYCSGTLIAPKVFLTAAHCAEASPNVRVSFSSAYKDGDTVYTGTFHGDPAYSQTQSDPHDIAVVVLDKAVKITPSKLPKANSLSSLPKDQQFTSVGYGAYTVTNTQGAGGHTFVYNDVRGVATGTLNSINASWLRISMNPSTGNGGTCYGDSGGPNYLGTTNIIAATTITGDAVCRSTNVDYRLDTASARGFLGQYVILP